MPKPGTDVAAGLSALPDGAQPLYARLRDRLRADILEGRLGPHQQLPSESELTGRYNLSRITVRQALADLHRDGLIVKVHGKGSFVAPPRPSHVSQELTRLTGLSEALGRDGHEIRARVLRLAETTASAETAARLAIEPGTRVAELLSLRYMDRQPLSLNRSYMPAEVGARLRRTNIASQDILSIFEHELGIAVVRAEVMISAGAADKSQARHLQIDEGAPVLCVDRVVFTGDERPLCTEASRYRSDAFSYRLTLKR